MKYILFLVGGFILLFTAMAGKAASVDAFPEVGKLAPSFELKDLSGKKVPLSSLKGKVVLLNFWATTCSPCKAEMPSLNNLHEALKNEGFIVLAVSVDTSDKPVRAFLSGKGIAFPILLDKEGEVHFDGYAVFGLPTSFLIDRSGIIVEKVIGPREWDSAEMKNKIRRLTASK